MADLTTITGDGTAGSGTRDWPNQDPLNVDEGTDSPDGAPYCTANPAKDGTQETSFSLDNVDSDLSNVDTLSWEVRWGLTGTDNDTYHFDMAIYSGATLLAAETSGGTWTRIGSITGPATRTLATQGPTAFNYVNTSATRTQWNAAEVKFRVINVGNKGGDNAPLSLDGFQFTGTYTASSATAASISLSGQGIASAEAVSQPAVNASATIDLTGQGIASAESVSEPTLTAGSVAIDLTGQGIASAESVSQPTLTAGSVTIDLTGQGIASTESISQPTLTAGSVAIDLTGQGIEGVGGAGASPSATNLTEGQETTTPGSATTASISAPGSGEAIIVLAAWSATAGASQYLSDVNVSDNFSGSSATWTVLGHVQTRFRRFITVWVGTGGSGSGTLNITNSFSASTGEECQWIVDKVTDADATEPTWGFTQDHGDNVISTGPETVTLPTTWVEAIDVADSDNGSTPAPYSSLTSSGAYIQEATTNPGDTCRGAGVRWTFPAGTYTDDMATDLSTATMRLWRNIASGTTLSTKYIIIPDPGSFGTTPNTVWEYYEANAAGQSGSWTEYNWDISDLNQTYHDITVTTALAAALDATTAAGDGSKTVAFLCFPDESATTSYLQIKSENNSSNRPVIFASLSRTPSTNTASWSGAVHEYPNSTSPLVDETGWVALGGPTTYDTGIRQMATAWDSGGDTTATWDWTTNGGWWISALYLAADEPSALGLPALSSSSLIDLSGQGIASAESVSQPTLTAGSVTIDLTGEAIPSAEAIGLPDISTATGASISLSGEAINSAEAFGQPTLTAGSVAIDLTGQGVASQESVSQPTLTAGSVTIDLSGQGIASAESIGQPDIFEPASGVSLTYSSDGDTNGLFYYLGTNASTTASINPLRYRNTDTRTLSTDATNYPWKVADRTSGSGSRYISNDATGQYIQIGLPGKMVVTDYLMKNSFDGQNSPRNWVVEGSNDLSGSWTTIDSRTSDTTLSGSGVWGHFTSLSGDTTTPFQWVRIRQTGTNSNSNNRLVLDELELYGTWQSVDSLNSTPAGHTVYNVRSEGASTDGGIFYNIGTDEGESSWSNPADGTRLTATASSNSANAPRATDLNISDSNGRWLSTDTPNSWIKWDFGTGSSVTVQGWMYHPSFDFNHVFEIGELQGSNNDSTWDTLGTYDLSSVAYRDGNELNYFGVDDITDNTPYRYIRIIQTGLNSTNTDYMSANQVELFGTYISPAGASISLSGEGIASGEAVSEPSLSASVTLNLSGEGISSLESVSQPTLTAGSVTVDLSGQGIATAESVSQPTLTAGSVTIDLSGQGIASAESVSQPTLTGSVTISLSGEGIASAESVSQPTLTAGSVTIDLTGEAIGSAESVSQPSLSASVTVDLSGEAIPSAEVIGEPTLYVATDASVSLSGQGIASAEAIGQPEVTAATFTTVDGTALVGDAYAGDMLVGTLGGAVENQTISLADQGLTSQESVSQPTLTAGSVAINLDGDLHHWTYVPNGWMNLDKDETDASVHVDSLRDAGLNGMLIPYWGGSGASAQAGDSFKADGTINDYGGARNEAMFGHWRNYAGADFGLYVWFSIDLNSNDLIANTSVHSTMASAIYTIVNGNPEIDGIWIDSEPGGDMASADWQNLISEIKTQLPNVWIGANGPASPTGNSWSNAEILAFTDNINVISPMFYDYIESASTSVQYIDWVKTQTRRYADNMDAGCQLLPSTPTYSSATFHDPAVENLTNAHDGILAANRPIAGTAAFWWFQWDADNDDTTENLAWVDEAPGHGIFSAEEVGYPTLSATSLIDLTGQAIGSAESVSQPTLTAGSVAIDLTGESIASAEVLGEPTLAASVLVDLTGEAISSQESVSQPTITGGSVSIDLSGEGVSSAEAFGQPVLTAGSIAIDLTGESIASQESVSQPTLTAGSVAIDLSGQGIASNEAVSQPSLSASATVDLTGQGIASEESVSQPNISAEATIIDLTGEAIASGEALGDPTLTAGSVAIDLTGEAIDSQESVSQPTLTAGSVAIDLSGQGIISGEAFGLPDLQEGTSLIVLTGEAIASAEALGQPTLTAGSVTIDLSGQGIASGEAVGQPNLQEGVATIDLTGEGILSGEVLGEPALTAGSVTIDLTGESIDSAEFVSEPTLTAGSVTIDLSGQGIASGEAVGLPELQEGTSLIILTDQGIASLESVSEPTLTAGSVVVDLTGQAIGSEESVSQPAITAGSVVIDLTGEAIASQEFVSEPTLSASVTIDLTGESIASQESVSQPTVNAGSVTIDLSGEGIASGEALGLPELQEGTSLIILTGEGIASVESVSQPTLNAGSVAIDLSGQGIASEEALGLPDIASLVTVIDLTGEAIPSAESVSEPSLSASATVDLSSQGISSEELVSEPTLTGGSVTIDLSGEGILSSEAFGLPDLQEGTSIITLTGEGISSAEAFGQPTLTGGSTSIDLSGEGVASGELVSEPTLTAGSVTIDLSGQGIASGEAVGLPELQEGTSLIILIGQGIASSEAIGQPTLTGGSTSIDLSGEGIASGEAIGELDINSFITIDLSGEAIDSQEATGQPSLSASVTVDLTDEGILSGESVSEPTLTAGSVLIDLSGEGISSEEAVGQPDIFAVGTQISLDGEGIGSAEAFGEPSLTAGSVAVDLSGQAIDSGEVVSEPTLTAGSVVIDLAGQAIDSGEVIGQPSVDAESITINLSGEGIATAESSGQPSLSASVAIDLSGQGIQSGESVPNPGLYDPAFLQILNLNGQGINSREAFGEPTLDIIPSPKTEHYLHLGVQDNPATYSVTSTGDTNENTEITVDYNSGKTVTIAYEEAKIVTIREDSEKSVSTSS